MPAVQLDLYCLDCGYNLRGLDGDPVRCPECGHHNHRQDLAVPAEAIKKALRKLESGAAMCGAMPAVLLLLLFPLLIAMVLNAVSRPPNSILLFLLGLVVVCLVLWIEGIFRFRASCEGKPGWVGAMIFFSACAFIIAGLGLSVLVIIGRLIVLATMSWPTIPLVEILFGAAVSVCLLVAATLIYRRAKREIHRLQRETAARTARSSLDGSHLLAANK